MHLDYIIGNSDTSYKGLIRSYADDPSTTGSFADDGSDYSQQELLNAVNMEHKHLFTTIRNLCEDWFMRNWVFATVANQYKYLMPRELINQRSVEFLKSAGVSGSSPNYVVDETAADPSEVQEVHISAKDNLRYYTSSNRVIRTNGYYMYDDYIHFLQDSRIGSSTYGRIYYLPTAPDLHRAVAASGTASTIVLGTNGAATTLGYIHNVDNYYQNMYIEIFSGIGEGQIRKISSYDGATKTATVDPDWTTTPDSTSVYSIVSPIKEDFQELLALGAVMRMKGIKIEDDVNIVAQLYGALMTSMVEALESRNRQAPRRVVSTQRSGVWY